MRTVDEMYEAVRGWELDAGEDFLDYFNGSFNAPNFMFWALGKGYIDSVQFQIWENEGRSFDDSGLLFGDEEYSVVLDDGDNDKYAELLEKAYRILAEFLASSATYQKRVEEFLSECKQVKFEEALKQRHFKKVFFVFNDDRFDLEKDTPLTPDIIAKSKWYIDSKTD